jgi:hypothetical protein
MLIVFGGDNDRVQWLPWPRAIILLRSDAFSQASIREWSTVDLQVATSEQVNLLT